MAEMLSISAEIPASVVADFSRACDRFRTELGNSQAVAVRRGTIALVRGLRARTAKAKRQVPLKDVTRYRGDGPKYITPKGRRQKPQPRWAIRRRGGDRERVYVKPAESRAAARLLPSAQYMRWGLARKSWGWFMQSLFNRANPESANPKAVVRPDMVESSLREVVTGANPRIEVTLVNKLGYIRDALPENALAAAMSAATKYIDGQIDRGIAKARKELE